MGRIPLRLKPNIPFYIWILCSEPIRGERISLSETILYLSILTVVATSLKSLNGPLIEWERLSFNLHRAYIGAPGVAHPGSERFAVGETRMWWMRRGSVRITVEGDSETNEHGAGTWLLLPNLRPHRRRFSDDAELLSIWFRAQWPDGTPLFPQQDLITLVADEHPDLTRGAERLERSVRSLLGRTARNLRQIRLALSDYIALQKPSADWLHLYAATVTGLGMTPAVFSGNESLRSKIRAVAEEWPIDRSFDRDRAAAACDLSASRMDALFTEAFGVTARQHWDGRRAQCARDLLASPKKVQPKRVAAEIGFTDLAAFSKWFRKHVGTSPRAFQEQLDQQRRSVMK